ncbi:MAG: hypothetical protein M1831_000432 [Alyxoria varia]|nr:MAG: hypothetical protein M1831_000432 [Alyxoria varia]
MHASTTALVGAAFALASTSSAAQYPTSNNYGFNIDKFKTRCNGGGCSYYCEVKSDSRPRIPGVSNSACLGDVGEDEFTPCDTDSADNDLYLKVVKKPEGRFQVLVRYDFIDKLNGAQTQGLGETTLHPGYGGKAPCRVISTTDDEDSSDETTHGATSNGESNEHGQEETGSPLLVLTLGEDENDGSTNGTSIGDHNVNNSNETTDGTTSIGDNIVNNSNETTNGTTPIGDNIVNNSTETTNGTTPIGDNIVNNANETTNGTTPIGDNIVNNSNETTNGTTSVGDNSVNDSNETTDGSTSTEQTSQSTCNGPDECRLMDACARQSRDCHGKVNQGVSGAPSAAWCDGQNANCIVCAGQQAQCYKVADRQKCMETANTCYLGNDTSHEIGGRNYQSQNGTELPTGPNKAANSTQGGEIPANVCEQYQNTCTSGQGQGECTADMQACNRCKADYNKCYSQGGECKQKAVTCYSKAGIPQSYYGSESGVGMAATEGQNSSSLTTTENQNSTNVATTEGQNATNQTGTTNSTDSQTGAAGICEQYENECRTNRDSNGTSANQSTCSANVAACKNCKSEIQKCAQGPDMDQCKQAISKCFQVAGVEGVPQDLLAMFAQYKDNTTTSENGTTIEDQGNSTTTGDKGQNVTAQSQGNTNSPGDAPPVFGGGSTN